MPRLTPLGPVAALVGLLTLLLVVPPRDLRASEGTACHPALDPDQTHYVIGYGSLMETASKERTWQHTGANSPVQVRGFERSWSARGTDIGFSATFLGIEPKDGAEMVATLYRVYDIEDFVAGDAREYVYCRVQVEPSQITMLDGSRVPTSGRIWIYMVKPESRKPAGARFPVIQSYVDTFLNGCIDLARHVVVADLDFLTACITTTKGWPFHWVNDRVHPRRSFLEPNAMRIDQLLHRILPEQFAAIRIE